MLEKNWSYFEKKHYSGMRTIDKVILYREINEIIWKYNKKIRKILETKDITDRWVQKALIFYQNNKVSCMVTHDVLRRKDIILLYIKKINRAQTISQLKRIKEDLNQQRINAPEVVLYLTDEERDYVIEKIQEKYKTILLATKEAKHQL